MSVVVTDDAWGATDERSELLFGLLRSGTYPRGLVRSERNFDLHRLSDSGGRPSEATSDEWLHLKRSTTPAYGVDIGVVEYRTATHEHQAVVSGREIADLAARFGSALYAGDDATVHAKADAELGLVAEAAGADLLITTKPILVSPPVRLLRYTLALTPAEALPIVGLYLRTQRTFIVERSRDFDDALHLNRGLLYWIATRALLPAGWRWMSACMQQSSASGDETLSWLSTALHTRVERALRTLDHVKALTLRPQHNDVADETLEMLDLLLFSLAGAFDASALVAARTLDVDATPSRTSWQHREFRGAIRHEHPALADIFAADSASLALLRVLTDLRNSVHGEAISPMITSVQFERSKGLIVGLPRNRTDRLRNDFACLGGTAAWGVVELTPGRLFAQPDTLAHQLVVRCVAVLDDLLSATPIDRLPLVDRARIQSAPPRDDQLWSARTAERVLWQMGLR